MDNHDNSNAHRMVATSPANSLQKSASGSVKQAYLDRLMLSEATEAAARMLDANPYAAKTASKSYIGAIATLLCQYPRTIATECADPVLGVMRECEFLPSVAKVVSWCEARVGTMRTVVDYDDRTKHQLAERARLEREVAADTPEHRAAVVQRIRKAMAAAGMPILGDEKSNRGELDAETVRKRFGLTEAEWNAIPEGPAPGHWERLQAQHAIHPREAAE